MQARKRRICQETARTALVHELALTKKRTSWELHEPRAALKQDMVLRFVGSIGAGLAREFLQDNLNWLDIIAIAPFYVRLAYPVG